MHTGGEIHILRGARPHKLTLGIEEGHAVLAMPYGLCQLDPKIHRHRADGRKDLNLIGLHARDFPAEELGFAAGAPLQSFGAVPVVHG